MAKQATTVAIEECMLLFVDEQVDREIAAETEQEVRRPERLKRLEMLRSYVGE